MSEIFWTSFFFILYTYLGYPLYLWMLTKVARKNTAKAENFPTVSVVVAAHNEERNIAARLDNLILQDYPADKYEIIIVSDGSTDGTSQVVQSYQSVGVRLIELSESHGKAVALNFGVAAATGKIIVFTDSRQQFKPGTVRELAANFSDSTVGCVSGELIFIEDVESQIRVEMGAYWKYEKMIRRMESSTGSVVGATGAIYAIRRDLYQPLPEGTILDDVLTPMRIIMKGYRTVFDGDAQALDIISKNTQQEWRRKVRTLAGNWQLLSLESKLLLPLRNPLFFRFLLHKLFRLLVPLAMILIFLGSVFSEGRIFLIATLSQVFFYALAFSGACIPAMRNFRLANLSYFFLVMNLAAVAGFWRWISGGCATAWKPAYAEERASSK